MNNENVVGTTEVAPEIVKSVKKKKAKKKAEKAPTANVEKPKTKVDAFGSKTDTLRHVINEVIIQAKKPMTPAEIGEKSGRPSNWVWRALKRLEAKGFIKRNADGTVIKKVAGKSKKSAPATETES